ncbi:hypothetical protein RhiJN_23435 [Ceratobasidium sp. AG-Ba]|nr:hypothetical protein RhiJN_23435 [Ceratobasidium sp. AG-Ba]
MPFIESIGSSSRKLRNPAVSIAFPFGWEGHKGPLFDWYRNLSCRNISRLQIRKDASGTVPHRFVVAHLADRSIHRFDRRPRASSPGTILTAGLLNTSIIEAADEVEKVELESWPLLDRLTKCEVDLDLENKTDVLAIISACYGISRDNYAHNYALFQYNCYFFSWTILAVVARQRISDGIPNATQVLEQLKPKLKDLATDLAEEALQTIMKAALETISVFTREIGYKTLMRGNNWSRRLLWSIPMPIMRFLLKKIITFRLHPSLKPHITEQLISKLEPKLRKTLESKLTLHLVPANIHNALWLSEVHKVVGAAIREEITDTFWDTVWDTVGGAGEQLDAFKAARETAQARIAEGHGGNEAQFCAMWNAAIWAALPAVRDSARGRLPDGTVTRETIFDDAWRAARDAALGAARAVIEDTGPHLNNPKRDKLWERIWEVWDQSWGAAQTVVRQSVINAADKKAKELVEAVVHSIVVELDRSHLKVAAAKVSVQDVDSDVQSTTIMTHAQLQDSIQRWIRSISMENDYNLVSDAMCRVWKTSRAVFSRD